MSAASSAGCRGERDALYPSERTAAFKSRRLTIRSTIHPRVTSSDQQWAEHLRAWLRSEDTHVLARVG